MVVISKYAHGEVSIPSHVRNFSELSINQRFLVAASRGSGSAVAALLKQSPPGLNVRATDSRGMSALHLATIGGFAGIVKLLLDDERTHINATDKLGRHPLVMAWASRNLKIAKMIFIKMIERAGLDQSTENIDLFLDNLFADSFDIMGNCQDLSYLSKLKITPDMESAATLDATTL